MKEIKVGLEKWGGGGGGQTNILRWNGVMSMMDVCQDARKENGCQFLTRQGRNSHVFWGPR